MENKYTPQDELEVAVRKSFLKNKKSLEDGSWMYQISRDLQKTMEEDGKALNKVLAEGHYYIG